MLHETGKSVVVDTQSACDADIQQELRDQHQEEPLARLVVIRVGVCKIVAHLSVG